MSQNGQNPTSLMTSLTKKTKPKMFFSLNKKIKIDFFAKSMGFWDNF